MKRVFSSTDQCAHVWAQQTQPDGRAGNLFFENTTDIYSYGRHYLAARVHVVKGRTFALINSRGYSISTAKHLYAIRRALHGKMDHFNVATGAESLSDARKYLDAQVNEVMESVLRRQKITSASDIEWSMRAISDAKSLADSFREINGLGELKVSAKKLDECKKHLKARLKRYQELNTPEMIAAKEKKREIRESKKLETEIAEFRSHKRRIVNTGFQLLRINGNRVETSKGAHVPLDAARFVLEMLSKGHDVTDLTVGAFKIDALYGADGTDPWVKAGCHQIKVSEIKSVLKGGVA